LVGIGEHDGAAYAADKKQLTYETASKLGDISLKQAGDEAQRLVIARTQAEEQRARAEAEAARAAAQVESEREAKNAGILATMTPEQRAAVLSAISQCIAAGLQKNTPLLNECVFLIVKGGLQARADDEARRAAALRFGLGMLGNSNLPPAMAAGRAASPGLFPDPPPIQAPPPLPKTCSSFVNGQWITTRCF
jgi:hypothetical protein